MTTTTVEDPGGLTAHIARARTALTTGAGGATAETVDVRGRGRALLPGNIAFRALARLVTEDNGVEDYAALRGRRDSGQRPAIAVQPARRHQVVEQARSRGPAVLARRSSRTARGQSRSRARRVPAPSCRKTCGTARIDGDVLFELARMRGRRAQPAAEQTTSFDAADLDGRSDASSARFALRYGGRQAGRRGRPPAEVRQAFNSPFWPFVLASTSVGQEGHRLPLVVPRRLPLEHPRQPRRLRTARGPRRPLPRPRHPQEHRGTPRRLRAGSSDGRNPWDHLYEAARDFEEEYGGFSPSWVYPGPAKIERHVAPILLSSDAAKYARVKKDVALYRLTFGQPRQEDLLELLRRHQGDFDPETLRALRINLAP